jgi:L-malate glycosyltransferase
MVSKKIKILHIIKSLGRGGAEMLLPETLKLHDKNRFEFHFIYFLPWKNQMVESIRSNGGEVFCIAANNNFRLMLKINDVVRYVRDNKIQLIHAHLPWAGILARSVRKHTGVPLIYTEHNKQERYHFATRWMNLATMNDNTKIIAVSGDVAESIHKHKPKVRPSITTILNGVNTDHFKREYFEGSIVRRQLGIPADAPIIGTIAVFRFQKRLDLWMELANDILTSNREAHFIIVGDGPLKDTLLRKRQSLRLEDRIHMPGLQTEVRPYLASFNIYMMSSIFEGLPVALLEAMSMRCPIISTDAGGIKEVIRPGVDGFLCGVDEPQKLVGYACDLVNHRSIMIQYADRARARVVDSFSMGKMVCELEALYTKTALAGS